MTLHLKVVCSSHNGPSKPGYYQRYSVDHFPTLKLNILMIMLFICKTKNYFRMSATEKKAINCQNSKRLRTKKNDVDLWKSFKMKCNLQSSFYRPFICLITSTPPSCPIKTNAWKCLEFHIFLWKSVKAPGPGLYLTSIFCRGRGDQGGGDESEFTYFKWRIFRENKGIHLFQAKIFKRFK